MMACDKELMILSFDQHATYHMIACDKELVILSFDQHATYHMIARDKEPMIFVLRSTPTRGLPAGAGDADPPRVLQVPEPG